jgi:hypothetical protein
VTDKHITLTQHLLGMAPFVLLTARVGDDGPDDLRMDVEFGGGPENVDDARSMLLLALPSLGATAEEIESVLAEVQALAQAPLSPKLGGNGGDA